MQRSGVALVVHGVVGGVVAGIIVAIWFLIVDALTTQAFYTPALLASTILGEEFQSPSLRLVLTYTVLHLGVFAVLGLATAWFLKLSGAAPGLLIGAVFGVGVLNTVHYGGLLITGVDLLTVLPVAHVVAANFLGGMVMMVYLHWAWRSESAIGFTGLADLPLLQDGLVTGIIGAGAVALWFFVVDLLTSTPFFTPAALGAAFFLGASSPTDVQVNLAIIVAYSFLHVAAFCAVGLAFAWAADRVERAPGFWLLTLMGFIVVEALFLAVAGIVSEWVLGAVGWIQIGFGNLVGIGAMGTWVWRSRPKLRERFAEEPVTTQV